MEEEKGNKKGATSVMNHHAPFAYNLLKSERVPLTQNESGFFFKYIFRFYFIYLYLFI